jgi:hypothetical protein
LALIKLESDIRLIKLEAKCLVEQLPLIVVLGDMNSENEELQLLADVVQQMGQLIMEPNKENADFELTNHNTVASVLLDEIEEKDYALRRKITSVGFRSRDLIANRITMAYMEQLVDGLQDLGMDLEKDPENRPLIALITFLIDEGQPFIMRRKNPMTLRTLLSFGRNWHRSWKS